MPIGSGIVYNTGDLILSQVSSSGTAFLETKIAAATSSIIYFDNNARINSASLNSLTVGTASYVSGSNSIITNLTASNISASGAIIATSFTGSLSGSITNALTASYLTPANSYTITNLTASNISASGYVSASRFWGTTATFTNISSSGPIVVSGSNAYIQLLPVGNVTIPTNTTASYIYVSGSTNDLYFTQYQGPFTNTTRLRWLESNMYTGILFGGQISSTVGSTTFNIKSGSGLIVSMNATTGSDPYPTIKQISWPDYNNQPITNSGSAKITYVGLDNTGQIVQQTNAWGSSDINQWDTQINLGVVLHLSGSVSTGVFNSPQISYGYPQKTDDFFRAFGPLKISGHTLQASGSSPTLSIKKTGGTSYREGANYNINPNHPSTVVENDITVSKIYRYYISGSTPIIDSGINNAGYTAIDNLNYVDTTTGTLATVGSSYWSIQRVFWIPNSPTNAFIVYYGNARYGNLLTATNAIDSEPFTEAPNTALNAIFIGYIIVEGGGSGTPPRDLLNANESSIIQGGLFRNVGGIGNGGTSPVPVSLSNLSDVAISGVSQGDLLIYGNGTQWNNSKTLNGSYVLTGNLSASATITANTLSASVISASRITGSLFGTSSWASNALTASFLPVGTYNITSSWSTNALTASYLVPTNSYTITNLTASNISASLTGSFGIVGIGTTVPAYLLDVSGSSRFGFTSTNTHQFTGSVSVVGSVTATSFTGSLSGSITNATSASFALTSSYINPSGNAFVQGGNSFGTTALLGTNDANSLAFETNGSTRMTINSGGQVGIGVSPVSYYKTYIAETHRGSLGSSSLYIDTAQNQNQGLSTSANDSGITNVYTVNNFTSSTVLQNQASFNQMIIAGSGSFSGSYRAERNGILFSNSASLDSSGNIINTYLTNQISSNIPTFSIPNWVAGTQTYVDLITGNSTGSITNLYNHQIGSPFPSGGSGGITVNNSYGIYIAKQKTTNIVTNGWGIYQIDTGDLNIFAGKTRIGSTTVPVNTLDVTGNISASVVTASLFFGTASLANTASSLIPTNSYTITNLTASNISASSITGSHFGTSSWATSALTASNLVTGNSYIITNLTASNISASLTGSFGIVGIGTTNPAYKLDVNGNANFTNGFYTNTDASSTSYFVGANGTRPIIFQNNTATSYDFGFKFTDSNTFTIVGGNTLANPTTDLVSFTYDGKVGIGTTVPGALLHVYTGSIGGTAYPLLIDNNSGGAGVNVVGFGFANGGIMKHSITTAIYGNDYMAFNVGQGASYNQERMRINSDGNVGIGTTSPGEKLTVSGSSYIIGGTGAVGTGTAYYLGDSSNKDISLTRVGAASLAIGRYYPSAWAETIRFTADGNVGIGTTSPTARLHVSGSTGGVFEVDTAGGTTTFYVSASGNVGIGTSSPIDKLDINSGNIRLSDNYKLYNGSSNDSVGIYFSNTLQANIAGYSGIIFRSSATNISSQTERMRIDSNGNVGIGTTSPVATLHVSGSSGATATFQGSTQSTMNLKVGSFDNYLVGTSTGDISIRPSGSTAVTILSGGNVGIGTSSPAQKLEIQSGSVLLRGDGTALFGTYYASAGENTFFTLHSGSGNTFHIGNDVAGTNYTTMVFSAATDSTGGKVGIGTTSPGSKLQINDNTPTLTIRANDGGVSRKAYIDFYTTFFNFPSDVGARRTSTIVTGFDSGTWGTEFLSFNVGSGSANDAALLPIERVRIDGSGNLGVGTSTIIGKLQVNSTSAPYYGPATSSATANGIFILGNTTADVVNTFGVDATTTAYAWIQPRKTGTATYYSLALNPNGGNVGIGTSLPAYLLDVSGSSRHGYRTADNHYFTGSVNISGSLNATASWANNALTASSLVAANSYTITNLTASNISASGTISASVFVGPHTGSTFGTASWSTNSLTSSYLITTNSYIITNLTASNISASATGYFNNLGVGTTVITEKVNVAGNILLSNGSNRFVRIGSSTNYNYDLQTTGNDFQIIEASTTPRLTIQYPNGNVGIGTTSPAYLLDVSGSSRHGYRAADTHQFTGSVNISGSVTFSGPIIYDNAVLLDYGSVSTPVVSTNYAVLQNLTGSYNSAFFDYFASSGSNFRAGTVIAGWSGSSVNYTEYATTDVGNTNQLSMSVDLSGSFVRLLTRVSTTINWNIKSAGRYL